MKTVKRIIAVFGLIFFLFAISYLVYTAKEVDFDSINIASLTAGHYLVSIETDNGTICNKKLIKK